MRLNSLKHGKEFTIRGDKLRKAMFLVWLANRFNDYITVADLRRMCGYASSGIYSAKESGWFIEKNGNINLTDKGELYLEKNILNLHESIRGLIASIIIMTCSLIIQNIFYHKLNILIMFRAVFLVPTLILLLGFHLFWYRIIWHYKKRKISTN